METTPTNPEDSSTDPEKGIVESMSSATHSSGHVETDAFTFQVSDPERAVVDPPSSPLGSRLRRWNTKIEQLAGIEARGITRVLPEERHHETWMGYVQMVFLWFSANLTANNLAVGFLGPLLFNLGFVDSALCSVFGAAVGCALTAYMSIWGAQSGNRTMVGFSFVPRLLECMLLKNLKGDMCAILTLSKIVARFFMGYWPSKLCCILNVVIMIGYGMIDCVISGQVLSAVSEGSISIMVGIVIVAVISLVVAVFGMSVFHTYERFLAIFRRRFLPFVLTPSADGLGSLNLVFSSFLLAVQVPSSTQPCRLSVRNLL
jgi:hypothetical protein